MVTRSRSYDGVVEAWDPDALAVEVVRLHLIEGLSDPAEQELLGSAFLRGETVTRSEIDSLSVEGTAVFDLLMGPEPDEVDEIFERLPAAVHESLRQISPSTGIDRLKARLLIMHDREDHLVPSDESRRLFDVVDGRGNTYYTEFSFFSHLDPTEQVGFTGYIAEGFKLFLHLYNVFRTF